MSKEQTEPEQSPFFGFSEREQLYNLVSHQRFLELIHAENTTTHKAEVSSNTYGEFLFITLSRMEQETQEAATFYGMGFHEYRERWITEQWSWYQTRLWPELANTSLSPEEVESIIRERQEEIAPYLESVEQSKRGKLYEMLADLTDEDGALSELQDLDDLGWLDVDE